MGALMDSWHTGYSERQPDPLPYLVRIQPDATIGTDGPEVEVPDDMGGCPASEAREALSQLIDCVSHAGEALGAGVGVFAHESSILWIAGPRQGPSAT